MTKSTLALAVLALLFPSFAGAGSIPFSYPPGTALCVEILEEIAIAAGDDRPRATLLRIAGTAEGPEGACSKGVLGNLPLYLLAEARAVEERDRILIEAKGAGIRNRRGAEESEGWEKTFETRGVGIGADLSEGLESEIAFYNSNATILNPFQQVDLFGEDFDDIDATEPEKGRQYKEITESLEVPALSLPAGREGKVLLTEGLAFRLEAR